jgi:undecaprenyl-diphosphatase
LLLALAALVGWSRLHLQVHFPSDVLAGAIAAGLWVAGLHRLLWWDDPTRKGG